MTSHAQRFLVVVVKIAPSIAQSRESVKKSAEAPCWPRQATRWLHKDVAGLLYKFNTNSAWSFVCFFFRWTKNYRGSVVKKHFNGNLFFQILDTECVAGKRVLAMCQYNFPHKKKESKGRRECLR